MPAPCCRSAAVLLPPLGRPSARHAASASTSVAPPRARRLGPALAGRTPAARSRASPDGTSASLRGRQSLRSRRNGGCAVLSLGTADAAARSTWASASTDVAARPSWVRDHGRCVDRHPAQPISDGSPPARLPTRLVLRGGDHRMRCPGTDDMYRCEVGQPDDDGADDRRRPRADDLSKTRPGWRAQRWAWRRPDRSVRSDLAGRLALALQDFMPNLDSAPADWAPSATVRPEERASTAGRECVCASAPPAGFEPATT